MPANPAAMFSRPRVHSSLQNQAAKPTHERRCVLVLPAEVAAFIDPKAKIDVVGGKGSRFFTRSVVTDAVGRGEMRWVDRHHNCATYLPKATGTWQKTRSGPVCTMQMVQGERGRYVPVGQREPELVVV